MEENQQDQQLTLDQAYDRIATAYGIPTAIWQSLKTQESGGNTKAVSPKGARGAFQVMPGTFAGLGYKPEDYKDPLKVAEAGLRYLRNNYNKFKSAAKDETHAWQMALAAYHAGEGNVEKNLRMGGSGIPNTSDGLITTPEYVKSIWSRIDPTNLDRSPVGAEGGGVAPQGNVDIAIGQPNQQIYQPAPEESAAIPPGMMQSPAPRPQQAEITASDLAPLPRFGPPVALPAPPPQRVPYVESQAQPVNIGLGGAAGAVAPGTGGAATGQQQGQQQQQQQQRQQQPAAQTRQFESEIAYRLRNFTPFEVTAKRTIDLSNTRGVEEYSRWTQSAPWLRQIAEQRGQTPDGRPQRFDLTWDEAAAATLSIQGIPTTPQEIKAETNRLFKSRENGKFVFDQNNVRALVAKQMGRRTPLMQEYAGQLAQGAETYTSPRSFNRVKDLSENLRLAERDVANITANLERAQQMGQQVSRTPLDVAIRKRDQLRQQVDLASSDVRAAQNLGKLEPIVQQGITVGEPARSAAALDRDFRETVRQDRLRRLQQAAPARVKAILPETNIDPAEYYRLPAEYRDAALELISSASMGDISETEAKKQLKQILDAGRPIYDAAEQQMQERNINPVIKGWYSVASPELQAIMRGAGKSEFSDAQIQEFIKRTESGTSIAAAGIRRLGDVGRQPLMDRDPNASLYARAADWFAKSAIGSGIGSAGGRYIDFGLGLIQDVLPTSVIRKGREASAMLQANAERVGEELGGVGSTAQFLTSVLGDIPRYVAIAAALGRVRVPAGGGAAGAGGAAASQALARTGAATGQRVLTGATGAAARATAQATAQRTIGLGALGTSVGLFSIDRLMQSRGRGDSEAEQIKQAQIGAAEGAVFFAGGAAANWVGSRILRRTPISPDDLYNYIRGNPALRAIFKDSADAAIRSAGPRGRDLLNWDALERATLDGFLGRIGQKNAEAILLDIIRSGGGVPGAKLRWKIASEVASGLTRVAITGAGTFGIARGIEGLSNEEALDRAAQIALVDLAFAYGPRALKGAGNKAQALKDWAKDNAGRWFRFRQKVYEGEVVGNYTVDPEGKVYRAENVNPLLLEAEIVVPPKEAKQLPAAPNLKVQEATPEAVEKAVNDPAVNQVAAVLQPNKPLSVEELRKLTKLSPKKLDEAIWKMYEAGLIEITPDNKVIPVADAAQADLYSRFRRGEGGGEAPAAGTPPPTTPPTEGGGGGGEAITPASTLEFNTNPRPNIELRNNPNLKQDPASINIYEALKGKPDGLQLPELSKASGVSKGKLPDTLAVLWEAGLIEISPEGNVRWSPNAEAFNFFEAMKVRRTPPKPDEGGEGGAPPTGGGGTSGPPATGGQGNVSFTHPEHGEVTIVNTQAPGGGVLVDGITVADSKGNLHKVNADDLTPVVKKAAKPAKPTGPLGAEGLQFRHPDFNYVEVVETTSDLGGVLIMDADGNLHRVKAEELAPEFGSDIWKTPVQPNIKKRRATLEKKYPEDRQFTFDFPTGPLAVQVIGVVPHPQRDLVLIKDAKGNTHIVDGKRLKAAPVRMADIPSGETAGIAGQGAQTTATGKGGGKAAPQKGKAAVAPKPVAIVEQEEEVAVTPQPAKPAKKKAEKGAGKKPTKAQPVATKPPTKLAPKSETVTVYRGVKEGRDATDRTDTVGGGLFYTPDKNEATSHAGPKGSVDEATLTFDNLLDAPNWLKAKEMLGLPKSATMADIVNAAREQGYDGITFSTKGGKEYIDISAKRAPAQKAKPTAAKPSAKPAVVTPKTEASVKEAQPPKKVAALPEVTAPAPTPVGKPIEFTEAPPKRKRATKEMDDSPLGRWEDAYDNYRESVEEVNRLKDWYEKNKNKTFKIGKVEFKKDTPEWTQQLAEARARIREGEEGLADRAKLINKRKALAEKSAEPMKTESPAEEVVPVTPDEKDKIAKAKREQAAKKAKEEEERLFGPTGAPKVNVKVAPTLGDKVTDGRRIGTVVEHTDPGTGKKSIKVEYFLPDGLRMLKPLDTDWQLIEGEAPAAPAAPQTPKQAAADKKAEKAAQQKQEEETQELAELEKKLERESKKAEKEADNTLQEISEAAKAEAIKRANEQTKKDAAIERQFEEDKAKRRLKRDRDFLVDAWSKVMEVAKSPKDKQDLAQHFYSLQNSDAPHVRAAAKEFAKKYNPDGTVKGEEPTIDPSGGAAAILTADQVIQINRFRDNDIKDVDIADILNIPIELIAAVPREKAVGPFGQASNFMYASVKDPSNNLLTELENIFLPQRAYGADLEDVDKMKVLLNLMAQKYGYERSSDMNLAGWKRFLKDHADQLSHYSLLTIVDALEHQNAWSEAVRDFVQREDVMELIAEIYSYGFSLADLNPKAENLGLSQQKIAERLGEGALPKREQKQAIKVKALLAELESKGKEYERPSVAGDDKIQKVLSRASILKAAQMAIGRAIPPRFKQAYTGRDTGLEVPVGWEEDPGPYLLEVQSKEGWQVSTARLKSEIGKAFAAPTVQQIDDALGAFSAAFEKGDNAEIVITLYKFRELIDASPAPPNIKEALKSRALFYNTGIFNLATTYQAALDANDMALAREIREKLADRFRAAGIDTNVATPISTYIIEQSAFIKHQRANIEKYKQDPDAMVRTLNYTIDGRTLIFDETSMLPMLEAITLERGSARPSLDSAGGIVAWFENPNNNERYAAAVAEVAKRFWDRGNYTVGDQLMGIASKLLDLARASDEGWIIAQHSTKYPLITDLALAEERLHMVDMKARNFEKGVAATMRFGEFLQTPAFKKGADYLRTGAYSNTPQWLLISEVIAKAFRDDASMELNITPQEAADIRWAYAESLARGATNPEDVLNTFAGITRTADITIAEWKANQQNRSTNARPNRPSGGSQNGPAGTKATSFLDTSLSTIRGGRAEKGGVPVGEEPIPLLRKVSRPPAGAKEKIISRAKEPGRAMERVERDGNQYLRTPNNPEYQLTKEEIKALNSLPRHLRADAEDLIYASKFSAEGEAGKAMASLGGPFSFQRKGPGGRPEKLVPYKKPNLVDKTLSPETFIAAYRGMNWTTGLLWEASGLAKTILSSADISYIGRQMWFLLLATPRSQRRLTPTAKALIAADMSIFDDSADHYVKGGMIEDVYTGAWLGRINKAGFNKENLAKRLGAAAEGFTSVPWLYKVPTAYRAFFSKKNPEFLKLGMLPRSAYEGFSTFINSSAWLDLRKQTQNNPDFDLLQRLGLEMGDLAKPKVGEIVHNTFVFGKVVTSEFELPIMALGPRGTWLNTGKTQKVEGPLMVEVNGPIKKGDMVSMTPVQEFNAMTGRYYVKTRRASGIVFEEDGVLKVLYRTDGRAPGYGDVALNRLNQILPNNPRTRISTDLKQWSKSHYLDETWMPYRTGEEAFYGTSGREAYPSQLTGLAPVFGPIPTEGANPKLRAAWNKVAPSLEVARKIAATIPRRSSRQFETVLVARRVEAAHAALEEMRVQAALEGRQLSVEEAAGIINTLNVLLGNGLTQAQMSAVSNILKPYIGKTLTGKNAKDIADAVIDKLQLKLTPEQRAELVNMFQDLRGNVPNVEAMRALVDQINLYTRYVNLGEAEVLVKYGNRLLFSTRLMASSIQLVRNPILAAALPKPVRRMAYGGMLRALGVVATILTVLAMVFDAKIVYDDPTDPGFIRARIGDYSFDFTGGIAQYLTFFARIAFAIKDEYFMSDRERLLRNIQGKRDKDLFATLTGLTQRFVRKKASPVVGAVWSALKETNVMGEPTSWGEEIQRMYTPITWGEAKDAWEHDGLYGLVSISAELAGFGTTHLPSTDYYQARMIEDMANPDLIRNPELQGKRLKQWLDMYNYASTEEVKRKERDRIDALNKGWFGGLVEENWKLVEAGILPQRSFPEDTEQMNAEALRDEVDTLLKSLEKKPQPPPEE